MALIKSGWFQIPAPGSPKRPLGCGLPIGGPRGRRGGGGQGEVLIIHDMWEYFVRCAVIELLSV